MKVSPSGTVKALCSTHLGVQVILPPRSTALKQGGQVQVWSGILSTGSPCASASCTNKVHAERARQVRGWQGTAGSKAPQSVDERQPSQVQTATPRAHAPTL